MKLHKVRAGCYTTPDGRYEVFRQEETTECSHPDCDRFHQRFIENGMHWTLYEAWFIWDTQVDRGRGDYVAGNGPSEFRTMADAVTWLEGFLG